MIRALQVSIVIIAAIVCAGCAAWSRVQMKRVEQDWGVHKPKKVFIYQP